MKNLGSILFASSFALSDLQNNLSKLRGNLESLVSDENFGNTILIERITEWLETSQSAEDPRRALTNIQIKAIIAEGKTLQLQSFLGVDDDQEASVERGNVAFENDKFMNYGCYCSPSEIHMSDNNWLGTGAPMDEIDRLCQNLFFGYQCLKHDYDKCDATHSYDWKVGKNGLPQCRDPEGTCEGDLCRLDIKFSAELFKRKSEWKILYHADNGFDRSEMCATSNRMSEGSISNSGSSSGSSSGEAKTSCCGTGLKRHPFHLEKLECCSDGSSRPLGTC